MVWYSIIVNCTPVIGNGTDRDWNFLAISTVWSFVVDQRRSCYLLEYFIKLTTKMDKGLLSKRRKSNFNEKKCFVRQLRPVQLRQAVEAAVQTQS